MENKHLYTDGRNAQIAIALLKAHGVVVAETSYQYLLSMGLRVKGGTTIIRCWSNR